MSPVADLAVVDPRELTPSRIALHHAALLVSAVGRIFGERQPGFRHAALTWDREAGALAGWPVATGAIGDGQPEGAGRSARASLAFSPPSLSFGMTTIGGFGATIADLTAAFRSALDDAGLDGARLSLRIPGDLPPGPIQSGDAFAPDPPAAAQLGRWFDLADRHLAEFSSGHGLALPVPCWPDHFDLGVAVPLATVGTGRNDAQVGLGFSPGDSTIDEPYFYVTPWPLAPSRVAETPAPAGGRWQIEGWTGLALPASVVVAAADPDEVVGAFLERGFEIGRDLVLAA